MTFVTVCPCDPAFMCPRCVAAINASVSVRRNVTPRALKATA